jgi:hypothetical protein
MCEGLTGDSIERNEDRKQFACGANCLTVVMYRQINPADEDLIRLVRLGGQDQNVVDLELNLLWTADREESLSCIFIGRAQP